MQNEELNFKWNEKVEEEKEMKSLMVKYEDGTIEEFDKGFMVQIRNEGEEEIVSFNMLQIEGKDLATIVFSVIEFGKKLGLFDEK